MIQKEAGRTGKPKQVLCCRVGDETGGLDLEDGRER